ncbi:UNVERIFIED_CONTAM: hypothetical protein FKN15_065451, partial [Acipenser sinensis]
ISSLKKNIRRFSGFTFEEESDQYKKKRDILKRYKNAALKTICGTLDLEKSGKNNDLISRIMTFLMKPKSSGKPLPTSKRKSQKAEKRKRKNTGSAKKAKSKGTTSAEILTESSSEEEEKDSKQSSGVDDQLSENMDEPPKKVVKTEISVAKGKTQSTKLANVKKADNSQDSTKREQSTAKQEYDSDDEPLIKMLKKPPTDNNLKDTVYENYPDHDLTDRKDYIKKTVKELLPAVPVYEAAGALGTSLPLVCALEVVAWEADAPAPLWTPVHGKSCVASHPLQDQRASQDPNQVLWYWTKHGTAVGNRFGDFALSRYGPGMELGDAGSVQYRFSALVPDSYGAVPSLELELSVWYWCGALAPGWYGTKF